LGKFLGLRPHYTWIFVFALITAIVVTQFSEDYPLVQRIYLGLAVSGLFLTATAIRELVLTTSAFRIEAPIKKTVLFAFGGIHHENKDRFVTRHLPLLYTARFLSNLVLGVIFWGLYATFINAANTTAAGIVEWLAYIYFLLFLLHFLPAYPLEGGEILRMVLWRRNGDYYRATGIASWTGRAIGLLLMFTGVLVFIITRQWYLSLLIVLIGLTLYIAAGYARRDLKIYMALQNIRAEYIMAREYPAISEEVKIGQLVREHILKRGWRYSIVLEGTRLKGLLTLKQVKQVPLRRFGSTNIGAIMTPKKHLGTADPGQTADTIYEEMYRLSTDYIPVMEGDNVAGVVTREALLDLVKVHSSLGV
jgi:Zn-dependent protease